MKANVANPEDIKQLIADTILVNNTGVCELFPLEQTTPERFHSVTKDAFDDGAWIVGSPCLSQVAYAN